MATTSIGSDRASSVQGGITGPALEKYFDAVFLRDDCPLYFGTSGDYSIQFTSATGALTFGGFGTSATPLANATVGGTALSIFVNPTVTSGARFNTLRVESYLANTDTFAVQGSGLYTIRGVAGTKTGCTFKGSANQGYLAGVQGMLSNKGVIGDGNSGGIYACAMLAQIDGQAGTYGADTNLSALWVDNQAGSGAGPTASQLVNITNNGGAITNFLHFYGNNAVTNFMAIGTGGTAVVAVTGSTTVKTGALKVIVEGGNAIAAGTYYIPLVTALN